MILIISISCNAQKKTAYSVLTKVDNNNMLIDTFNIDLYEKNKVSTHSAEIEKENGEKIRLIDSEDIYVEYYTPPLPKFYWIYKEYYLNGKLKKKGYMLTDTKIGVWEYYDEKGNKTTEDMDKRYSKAKFSYNQVMLLLQELGHIDLNTGKGRDIVTVVGYIKESNNWIAEIRNDLEPPFTYYISGKNGKIIGKNTIIFVE